MSSWALAVRPFHVDEDVVARQRDLHLHVENLALMMVPVGRVHDYAAGLYAVAEGPKVGRELVDAGLDGGRGVHVTESDVDGNCHDSITSAGRSQDGQLSNDRPVRINQC
jgi:hypothetical protein